MSEKTLIATSPCGNYRGYIERDEFPQSPWEDMDLGFEYKFEIRRYLETQSSSFPSMDNKDYWFIPVYGYAHSGVTISLSPFGCRWDSGIAGHVAVKRPSKGGEWKTRKSFEKYLKGMVKSYDEYLQGNVYGIIIEDLDDEDVESCWGFYGVEEAEREVKERLNSLPEPKAYRENGDNKLFVKKVFSANPVRPDDFFWRFENSASAASFSSPEAEGYTKFPVYGTGADLYVLSTEVHPAPLSSVLLGSIWVKPFIKVKLPAVAQAACRRLQTYLNGEAAETWEVTLRHKVEHILVRQYFHGDFETIKESADQVWDYYSSKGLPL